MTFQPLAKRRHDEVGGPGLCQLELDRVLVAHVDLAHRGEQDRARDGDAGRRLGDAVEGGLDVVGGELGAVVELHVLAQEEGVGLAVLGNLPAVGEVGNDGLAAVARVAADEIVEHAPLGAEIIDGARLVHVEVRRTAGDAVAQNAATFGIGLGRPELELGAVELGGHLRQRKVGAQPIGRGHRGGAAFQSGLQDLTAIPVRTLRALTIHCRFLHALYFRYAWIVVRCELHRLPRQ